MTLRWLNRSLMENSYYMALCTTEKAFEKELKRLEVPRSDWPRFVSVNANATCHFFEKDDAKRVAIVCVGDATGKTPIELAGLLVHEAVHIWQEHCEFIGEHKPSIEMEAYAIQRISMDLMWAYAETVK